MGMGQHDRIEPAKIVSQRLLPEVRPAIDEDPTVTVANQQRAAKSFVPRIGGGTDRTVAADERHTDRGPRPQDHSVDRSDLPSPGDVRDKG